MLELLSRYARQQELDAEPGFAPKRVKWGIHVSADGRLLGVHELGDAEAKRNPGRVFRRCPELSQPEIKRGGKGCRHFLVDSAEVVALHHPRPDDKLAAKHAYFVGLLEEAARAVPELAAAVRCLREPESLAELQGRLEAQRARPTDNVTFAVEGAEPLYPAESDAWHDWWRAFRRTLSPAAKSATRARARPGAGEMRCLVSGELVRPVRTHPKLKGLADVGGLAQGDVLASFKQDAFRSYGLVQSANSAVSEEMAAEYRAALNHLIRTTGRRLASVKVVHWFKERIPAEDDPLPFLLSPPAAAERAAQSRARELLGALRQGRRPDLRGNVFYALTLSGAAGRVMVRDWMEGSFEELVEAVSAWFDDLAIVRRDGQGLAPDPKFLAVLGALVRDLKELPAPVETAAWRSALGGRPIPDQLHAMALARLRSVIVRDEVPRHALVGLLKAFHVRQGDPHMQPHLNEEHPDAAYHCGRLLAVLAALQYRALGDVGAGVVQRYYAAASATPALVLGRLIRNSQFHLEKLRSPRMRSWYQNKIATVMGRMDDDLPSILEPARQSLFALGYYQQIAHDRARTAAAGRDAETETDIESTEDATDA